MLLKEFARNKQYAENEIYIKVLSNEKRISDNVYIYLKNSQIASLDVVS